MFGICTVLTVKVNWYNFIVYLCSRPQNILLIKHDFVFVDQKFEDGYTTPNRMIHSYLL